MKILFKGLSVVALFFAVWLLLAQIDYVSIFGIKEAKSTTETSIGNLIWDEIKSTEEIIVNDTITKTIDKLIKPICDQNGIDQDSLKVHVIKKNEVNAFALPGNHLVVYTGLIDSAKNESALIGVLGHEIAHIENRHVMKKLSKEIGFSVLLSLTSGSGSAEVIKEIFHSLSSSAYDRSLEREADITSVEYMLNSKVNPAPFADFLYEMSIDSSFSEALAWVSTHPEAEERAKYVLEFIKGKKQKYKSVLLETEWKAFKKANKDL